MVDQAKKDLAESYQVMTNLAAWKHFTTNVLDRIEADAVTNEDNIQLSDLGNAIAIIAECRGRRKAIDLIYRSVDFVINGSQVGGK